MARFRIAGEEFDLDASRVEESLEDDLPDPVRDHYVVVRGRRFPPKQVISRATGLDRADFTTHQARRVLQRLGFVASRASRDDTSSGTPGGAGPYGGAQAAALAPFVGKWVALASPTEVLVAADDPRDVVAWLTRHGRRASYGMFRVPTSPEQAEGMAPL